MTKPLFKQQQKQSAPDGPAGTGPFGAAGGGASLSPPNVKLAQRRVESAPYVNDRLSCESTLGSPERNMNADGLGGEE